MTKAESARKTTSGWTHQASGRAVSPNRRGARGVSVWAMGPPGRILRQHLVEAAHDRMSAGRGRAAAAHAESGGHPRRPRGIELRGHVGDEEHRGRLLA